MSAMLWDVNNFQRPGASSNVAVGREFEEAAQLFFHSEGMMLAPNYSLPVGHRSFKKKRFDLGSASPRIIVECKSYTWTVSGNVPCAKIRGLNEAILQFSAAPRDYRKILFALRHLHPQSRVSLISHYIKCHGHLIGPGVEIWEFDADAKQGARVF
jgi:hypothetical protein